LVLPTTVPTVVILAFVKETVEGPLFEGALGNFVPHQFCPFVHVGAGVFPCPGHPQTRDRRDSI